MISKTDYWHFLRRVFGMGALDAWRFIERVGTPRDTPEIRWYMSTAKKHKADA